VEIRGLQRSEVGEVEERFHSGQKGSSAMPHKRNWLVGLSALFTSSIAAAVPVALAVFLGPACNAALFGYQAAITPDRLQGRVVSVIFLAATSAAAAAPVLAGVFVAVWGGPAAILFFAATVGLPAVAATISKGLRVMRPIEEVTVAG
jgi:MFS family permease